MHSLAVCQAPTDTIKILCLLTAAAAAYFCVLGIMVWVNTT